METKKITEDLRKKLNAPLDPKAVTKHPTKTYLSSIKAVYVTERLNDVFGVGVWRTKVQKIERSDNGMVVVKVIFEIPSYGVYYESYGGNDNGGENNKNFDLGDAYKGATTDAITKIGSYLEIGIDVFKGLSDKTSYSKENKETKWLNIYKKDSKELTPEMTEVYTKMKQGDYSSINDIRKEYAISKENTVVIEAWFIKLKQSK